MKKFRFVFDVVIEADDLEKAIVILKKRRMMFAKRIRDVDYGVEVIR